MFDIKVRFLIVFDAIFLFTHDIKFKNFSLCTFAFQAIISYKTVFFFIIICTLRLSTAQEHISQGMMS